MSGVIFSLPQYAFMAWCSVKAQGQLHGFPVKKEHVSSSEGFRKLSPGTQTTERRSRIQFYYQPKQFVIDSEGTFPLIQK
jgi:hypothetical protein